MSIRRTINSLGVRAVLFIAMLLFTADATAGEASASSQGSTKAESPSSFVYRIRGMRAYLYYQERNGFFDQRDILSGKLALRNVFAGEGSSVAPSGATLFMVDVEVTKSANGSKDTYLKVEGRESKLGVVGSFRVGLSDFFSDSESLSVPVIFYGRFCGDLTVTANLENGASSKPVSAVAHFTCGE